jgi:hypothetical protein
MTSISTRRLSASSDSLLRFAMRADATLCAAAGLFIAMAADPLSRLSGLSSTAEWIGGAGLVAYGALLYVSAAAPDLRRIGLGIVIGNVVFAAAVLVVVAAGWLPLTGIGEAAAIATAVGSLGFAYAQYRGVRRLA